MKRVPVEWIDRYLTGVSESPAEREGVEAWLATSPVHALLLDTMRTGGEDTRHLLDGVRGEDATWERIRRRTIGSAQRGRRPVRPWTVRGSVWPMVIGLAAGALLAVAGWSAGRRHWGASGGASMGTAASLTYTTGKGQRANITLPDGNTVVLNVASRLDVPADYTMGNHTVRLSGEAFFTVSHHQGHPFSVVAGGTTALVLGTSFAMRDYPTDTTVVLAVRSGRVNVGRTVVAAQQLLEIGPDGGRRLRATDASPFSFVMGVLRLGGMRLSEAIPELDRWYDADIRVGDPALAAQEIKGGFESGSLSDLSEILSLVLDVRVVRDGRVLTLYARTR